MAKRQSREDSDREFPGKHDGVGEENQARALRPKTKKPFAKTQRV
jgi:hypothetical protein